MKKKSSAGKEDNLSPDHILKGPVPGHIAIVMDGNGRWAKRQGLPRIFGHQQGRKVLRQTVGHCLDLGVKYLTVYAFSTENWKRPKEEVEGLMFLLEEAIQGEYEDLQRQGIRVKFLGELDELSLKLNEKIRFIQEATSKNEKLQLNICLNYGGRRELVEAFRRMAKRISEGEMDKAEINERAIGDYLYTTGMPDPDLLIRTGGEKRLSNFLLWQSAYAEIYFTEIYWPDFTKEHLWEAIADFQGRERRFGKTS